MKLKTIFWPWGRIKELEIKNEILAEEIDDLDQENIDLICEVFRQNETTALLARDFGIAMVALTDIEQAVAGVKTPNGTTKKIGKIVSEANDLLITKVGSDAIEVARKCKAAELANREAKAKADAETQARADARSNGTGAHDGDDEAFLAAAAVSVIVQDEYDASPSSATDIDSDRGGSFGGAGASGSWDSGSSSYDSGSYDGGSSGGGCD